MASKEFVRDKIAAAFAANDFVSNIVEEIAFHMTDWKEDLDQLVGLYENVDSLAIQTFEKPSLAFWLTRRITLRLPRN